LELSLIQLYKNVLLLEPAETQTWIGIISIPWSLKILYGFTSDNVRIFGSKRRGHILLNTLCCMISMFILITFDIKLGKYFITACCFVSQFNMAYSDTVTDALTVRASRGVENGSLNLMFLSQLM
jgi:hypothetical protein